MRFQETIDGVVSKAVDLDSLMIDEFRRDDLADDEWKLLGDSLQ